MKEEHDPQAVTRGSRLPQGYGIWSPYEDTEKRATDAYGIIMFPSLKSEERHNEAQVDTKTSSINSEFDRDSYMTLVTVNKTNTGVFIGNQYRVFHPRDNLLRCSPGPQPCQGSKILLRMPCAQTCNLVRIPCAQELP